MTTAEDVVEKIKLAPDAGLVRSLGAHHSLESALADLLDNSVDAAASRVTIRLLTTEGRLARVEVVDDGRGMDDTRIDQAMTIGHRREYGRTDLGHFGMGLKAASFAHADVLTVWSNTFGATPVGRRIRRADFSRDFTCEVLSLEASNEALSQRHRIVGAGHGTTVIWEGLRGTYRGSSADEAQAWLSRAAAKLRAHLGVVFHRLLTAGSLSVEIAVEDAQQAANALGVPVQPIDPFGYSRSGHPAYPKTLIATMEGCKISIDCHIWPGKSDVTGFRLGGSKGEEHQGFFVYRNDRILQLGGWSGTATAARNRQLARVILDDPQAIGRFVTMNSEKQGLRFEPIFLDALEHAYAEDGTTFEDFLAAAETAYAEARRRRRTRKPAIRPHKGFAPAVRKRIASEVPMLGGEAMRMSWTKLPEGEFLDFDLQTRTVLLNSRYRALFAPQGGSLNDAPVVKALVYLLTHHVMEGQYLGAKDKDNIALWKSVLSAAVRAEHEMRSEEAEW